MTHWKKIKAETFDKMQYFYGSVHNPLIRCLVSFDGHLDETVLKNAVDLSQKEVPLLSCRFYASTWKAGWIDRGFTAENIVRVIDEDADTESQKSRLLASMIDISLEPPLKIFMMRGRDADSLCVIVHHMLCDASGFKEYLYLLAELYSKITDGAAPELKPKPRNASLLYSGLSLTERVKILFSNYTVPGHEEQLSFPLKENGNTPEFITRIVHKQNMERIKEFAKGRRATVNDMLVTAYFRTLQKELGRNSITIPCPVDLRRYLSKNCEYGIANFTSNYICHVDFTDQETFSETLAKVSAQLAQQKSSNICLKGIMLLDFLFHVIPFRLLRDIFPKIFTIPVVSYSNLGIISGEKLRFGNCGIRSALMTAAVKRAPYFQLTVCTFSGDCTMSSNLYATEQDKRRIETFLYNMEQELLSSIT